MSQLSKFGGAWLAILTALTATALPQQRVGSADARGPQASPAYVESALAAASAAVANGRYEEGLRSAQDATSAARRLEDDGLTANSLGQQGVSFLLLARYPEAARVLEESLSLGQDAEIDQRLNDLTNLGVAYHYMGSYAAAVQTYETTLALAREHAGETNVRRREQIAAINLATLYQRLGMQQRALNLYREQAVGESALRPSEHARMLSNMGALYRRLGDPVKALEAYAQARTLYRQERNPRGELNTALNAAIARAFGLGRDDAGGELRQVMATAEGQGDRNQAVKARLYLGELALRQDTSQARALYQEVLDQARTSGLAEEQWRAEYGLARAAAGASTAESIGHLEQAILTIESVRTRIAAPSLSAEYLADRDEVYDDLIELRLAECCPADSSADNQQISQLLGLIGRQQARSFDDRLNARLSRSTEAGDPEGLERLRSLRERISAAVGDSETDLAALEAQFESLESELFRDLPDQSSMGLQRLQQRLGKDEAAWILWLGDRLGCVIWLTRDSAELSVLASSKAIIEQARLLRTALTRPGSSDWTEPAQELGTALFAMPSSFGDVSHLRLTSDASIAGIPLDVLAVADGQGESRQLLDEVTISYHPSLAELASTRTPSERGGRGLLLQDAASLVIANPASDVASALPFAVQEGRLAGGFIRGDDVFLEGAAATRAAVIQGIESRPEIVHFAVHAQLNDVEPEFSSLILGGRDLIYLGDVYTWDLSNTRLVTLSACDTADGRNTPGEGVTALDRAFLAAGASNVVATLWRVDDQATSLFMQRFYSRLGAGMSPSQAMKETKIDFRDSDGPYAHPAYWAAFTLSGEAVSPVTEPIPWRQALLVLALALGAFAALVGRRKAIAAQPR